MNLSFPPKSKPMARFPCRRLTWWRRSIFQLVKSVVAGWDTRDQRTRNPAEFHQYYPPCVINIVPSDDMRVIIFVEIGFHLARDIPSQTSAIDVSRTISGDTLLTSPSETNNLIQGHYLLCYDCVATWLAIIGLLASRDFHR